MKKIVYIGNNLTARNPTTILGLASLLKTIGFKVLVYSNKINKLKRLLDMCLAVIKHKNFDYLLIDTYSTSNFYYAFIVSQLARGFSLKYIPILHGGNLPVRLSNNPRLSNLIFKNSYCNVAPSNYLSIEFNNKGYKTNFISNAINIQNYEYKERKIIEPKLLWVRAFDKIYNPLMAIEVLSLLKEKYPTAQLCMVGPDKDNSLKDAKLLAKKLGVLDSIEFTGMLSKTAWTEKAKEFDIFINTTTIDNTPVSVIEAMALGLPVVSTNVGGVPYLINHGEHGMLVDNNNALQMMEAIEKLIKNPDLVSITTRNAKSLVANFDTVTVQEKWLNLLK